MQNSTSVVQRRDESNLVPGFANRREGQGCGRINEAEWQAAGQTPTHTVVGGGPVRKGCLLLTSAKSHLAGE